jgi:hypothetical protein
MALSNPPSNPFPQIIERLRLRRLTRKQHSVNVL